MSAGRASQGGGWWPPKRGSRHRRGGSAPSRGSPTTTRAPRPAIKPGLEDTSNNPWAAFANNPGERDVERAAQRQEEEARVAAERISQGLPAEFSTEISETQTIRRQDGSTTIESRVISTNEHPTVPTAPLVDVKHPPGSAEPATEPIGTTEEIPVISDPKTQSFPLTQQQHENNDHQQTGTISSDLNRSEQELQPTFTQSIMGYPIQEEDVIPLRDQPQEQRSPLKEESSMLGKHNSLTEAQSLPLKEMHLWPQGKLLLQENQGDAVELPVDQPAGARPSLNESVSDIISDDELDRTDTDNTSNVSHDKTAIDITRNTTATVYQDNADGNKIQYKTAYGQKAAPYKTLETAENASASPPRSIVSSDGASNHTERPPHLEFRVGEVIKAIDENYQRLDQLSQASSERMTSISRDMSWPPDEMLFGTITKAGPSDLENLEFKDLVSEDAVRPLNISKPASEDGLIRKTVYSQFPRAGGTKNGPTGGYNVSSIANDWRQEDHSLKSFLPRQFQGLPSRVSSSLPDSTASNITSRLEHSKHWILDSLAKLYRWIIEHPIVFILLLFGPILLANVAPAFDKDSFFKKPSTWTENILPLENTSLLRAIEAESTLQRVINKAVVSPRTNDSIPVTQHSCSKFVEAQVNDARFIYKLEQVTLAFIYKQMLSDLQTTIFQRNITLQNLANIYDKITKASQSLTNIDRQISQHIHAQRINSHQCVDAPGSTVKAHHERTNMVLDPRSNVPAFFDPALVWFRQFLALLWLLPDKTLAQYSPTGSSEPDTHLHADDLPLQHATPFNNHFRTIERSLQRSQRGHKGLRSELQHLEGDLSLLSKSWFTEEQLIPLNILRNWTRRLWHTSGEL